MKTYLTEDRPLFLQIRESIEEDIMNGLLGPDEQIPSTNQLVDYYNINPLTVLKGVNLLADEGLIYKKRGLGMFVCPGAQEALRRRFRDRFEAGEIQALAAQAKALGFSREEIHAMLDTAWKEADHDGDPM
jgi:DNA-binding transcriptional regulator YhcF (GntR family)